MPGPDSLMFLRAPPHLTPLCCAEDVEGRVGNDVADAGGSSGDAAFWEALQKLAWCPVLLAPPHPDLPWAQPGSRLAPPRMARPVRELHFSCHL